MASCGDACYYMVGRLLIGVLDIAFILSHACFSSSSIEIDGRCYDIRTATCLMTVFLGQVKLEDTFTPT